METSLNKTLVALFVNFFLFLQFVSAQESNLLDNFVEIRKDTLGKNHHFFINKYVVSVDNYKDYLIFQGLKLPQPPNYGWEQTQLPMVGVSYNDFMNYCNWLSEQFKIKFRAPTDSEWTIAAANQENPMQKLYGGQPAEVDFINPNKYGISGMNGNVWEWTSTKIDKNYQIIRGSSYLVDIHPDTLNVQRIAAKPPSIDIVDVGFRLVIDAKEMHKYLLAQEVEIILKKLFPEYTNLGVDAKALYINDGFINWEKDVNPIQVNEKEYYIKFIGINYLRKSKNQFDVSEKFFFDKKDLALVKKLQFIIEKNLK